jgi:peptidyl-tRNA hydrolase, PTH1 family
MLLFVGLGNPGAEYAGHRHNVGFMAVQAIAGRHSIGPWRRRFQGVTAEGTVNSHRVLLLEPGTYMNESGRAVLEAMHFYRTPIRDVLVFHDDVDLPFGKVRVKVGGGTAGHNGLRSISAHIGNEYRRIRIGVEHPRNKLAHFQVLSPSAKGQLVESYVLNPFSKSERPWVKILCEVIADNAALLVEREDERFQTKIHLAMEAEGFFELKRAGGPADKIDR